MKSKAQELGELSANQLEAMAHATPHHLVQRNDLELVNAVQDEIDAGDGGLRLVGPDDPRHSRSARASSQSDPYSQSL